MLGMMNAVYYFVVAVCIQCVVVTALTLEANVGTFFTYLVQRQTFFAESSLVNEAPVEFHSFVSGKADLPGWLGLWHEGDLTDAYLYGTPVSTGQESMDIQIIGYNKKTYQAVKRNVFVEVQQSPVSLEYFADLPLLNISMFELLGNDNIKQLRSIMNRWTRGEVLVTRVSSPQPDMINAVDAGITVRFGSTKHFSSLLKSIDTEAAEEECKLRPKVIIDSEFSPRFSVDWCRVQLEDLAMSEILGASAQSSMDNRAVFTTVEYNPPEWLDDRRHSLFPDFLACILVPAGVLLLLVLVLVCLLCCGRIGWEKRVRMTPEPQLVRYNSIRRASISLRQLSENRDLNLSSRSISMQGTGGGGLSPGEPGDAPRSAPGTLQRKREGSPGAPPPYRPPPAYSSDEEGVTKSLTEPRSDENETIAERPATTGRPRKTQTKGQSAADGSATQ